MNQKNSHIIKKFDEKYQQWLSSIRKENKKKRKIVGNPKPILKWAGGKRQLLQQIHENLPSHFNRYFEPFVGGGAVFFYLLPEKAVLIDNNPVLMNVYKVIQTSVQELIDDLEKHRNEKEYYYKVRKKDRQSEFSEMSTIEKASRMIFLNKTCYNGLFRVNKKGQFNVPFGRYKNPNYCDKENLLAVHRLLQNVELYTESFEKVLAMAKPNDFIYFDPPYVHISDTANFTSYTKDDFGLDDQEKLAQTFDTLDKRGCYVLLSNSHCDYILNRYQKYEIVLVKAKPAINSDASKRGFIKEVLIKNY